MQEPRWTEVDGVPVAWVDVAGPLRASLCFRVGMANETVPLRGVTHLVEHLALHGMHDRRYPLNGTTDLTETRFMSAGTPEETVEFLGTVCDRLGDLPAERVEVERQVLRAEADARTRSYRDTLLVWRYGAAGPGLAGIDEYGLRWLDAATVRWWAAQRFTRGNAILLLSGPPPAGLRLPLADGPAHPPVVAEATEAVIPGWFPTDCRGVAMSGVRPRRPGGNVAMAVLESELTRVLRFERGLTYSVGALSEALDATRSHVVYAADAHVDRHAELRDGFLEVVGRLADAGPDPAELERLIDRGGRGDADDHLLGYLFGLGADFAAGAPYESFELLDEAWRTMTPEGVTELVRAVADSALFMLPYDLGMPADIPAVPVTSPTTVAGRTFRGLARHEVLVVGDEGVSRVEHGHAVTVRWNETAATLWWGDGTRVVVGRDAFQVVVKPAEWEDGHDAVAAIDARAPRHAAVPMGEGKPPPPPGSWPAPTRTDNRAAAWFGLACGFGVALLFLVIGLDGPQPATEYSEEVTREDANLMIAVGAGGMALTLFLAWLKLRKRRRDRASQAEWRSVPS
ncbi:MAG TPA: insulinase family protein [Frankiaceae bacterium]|nr:insulinase family protein [Frankiaceae bacterium]